MAHPKIEQTQLHIPVPVSPILGGSIGTSLHARWQTWARFQPNHFSVVPRSLAWPLQRGLVDAIVYDNLSRVEVLYTIPMSWRMADLPGFNTGGLSELKGCILFHGVNKKS